MVLFRNGYRININSTGDSKKKFEEMANVKYKYIRVSGVFLVLSFVALAIAFLHYLDVFFY